MDLITLTLFGIHVHVYKLINMTHVKTGYNLESHTKYTVLMRNVDSSSVIYIIIIMYYYENYFAR